MSSLLERKRGGGGRRSRRASMRASGGAQSTPALSLSLPLTGTMLFMTSSGRMTPMDAMPTPDLAVPYAAPKPV